MKTIAQKSFIFSFLILIPFMPAVSRSGLKNYFSYQAIDTGRIKQEVPPQFQVRTRDTLQVTRPAIKPDSAQMAMLKIIASKLDTGLNNQVRYMQNQNVFAMEFVKMHGTILELNQKLASKSTIPAQVYNDAKKGNAQKWAFRTLVLGVFGIYLIVGLLVAIYVQVHNYRAFKQYSNA